MYSVKYSDYLISLTGACIVAFGLGAVVGDAIGNLAWALVVAGVVLHGIGMYRSNSKHH